MSKRPVIAPELTSLPHVPVDSLQELQGNFKELKTREYGKLKTVILKHGVIVPFFVWKETGQLIDGHQRRRVFLNEKWLMDVPVVYISASSEQDAKAKLLAISSQYGKVTQEGWDAFTWDLPDAAEWSQFDALPFVFGEFAEPEQPAGADAEPQVNRAEELREEWQVETGQLWRLPSRTPGNYHMLICGDCTDAAVVERVMGGDRARVIITSPPYSNQRDYEIGDFDWLGLAKGFIDNAFSILANPGDVLINLGLEHIDGRVNQYWQPWLNYCESSGYPLYGWYVWDKGSGFPGEWNGRLGPAHEWLFHFNTGRKSAAKWVETTGESAKRGAGGKRFRQKDGSLRELTSPDKIGQPFKVPDSVIRITREMARGIHTQSHPAVFPLELAEFILKTWSEESTAVYEPFVGSGTTIIAAENLSRQCRACEIAPGYVAVSLQRYLDAFGIRAELVDA